MQTDTETLTEIAGDVFDEVVEMAAYEELTVQDLIIILRTVLACVEKTTVRVN